MNYGKDIVEKVIDRLMSGNVIQRELEKVLKIPRKTLGKWFNRLKGQSDRFKRAAKKSLE